MRVWSQRERKLIAVLILFAVVGTVWTIVVGPILTGFRERTELRRALVQQYHANQRIIGSIPRLRRRSEQQREDLRRFVVSAPTPAAASIELQDRLQRTIENAGGEVRAIESVSGTDGLARARAVAQMSLAQTTTALVRLQNEPPFLAVAALNIAADEAVVSGRLERMEVSIDVSVPIIISKSR